MIVDLGALMTVSLKYLKKLGFVYIFGAGTLREEPAESLVVFMFYDDSVCSGRCGQA